VTCRESLNSVPARQKFAAAFHCKENQNVYNDTQFIGLEVDHSVLRIRPEWAE